VRRALVAAGVLVMGFAVVGAATDDDVRPFGVLLFLVGVVVWHDLLLMPLVIAAGAAIGRFVPAPARTPVRVAALCGLAVLVVALPLVLGVGRVPGDPSVLPRPYGWGLVLVLALLWTSALGVIAARRVRRRRTVSDPQGRAGG
jgi:hypothetical protein